MGVVTRRILNRLLSRTAGPLYRLLVPRLAPKGYSPGPRSLLIQLTYTCNLRCWFCGQWGVTGLYRGLPGSELQRILPLDLLQRLIDELPSFCTWIYLWGGETLQYPDIIPLVRYIKQAGKAYGLVTNGTLLSQHAAGLVEAAPDLVQVSVDADEETHDRMRGARGAYRAAMEGIRAIRAERDARRGPFGSPKPVIEINCTLFAEAAAALAALIREARAAGADRVLISKPMLITERMGQAYTETFRRLFDITPTWWKGYPQPEAAQGAAAAVSAVIQQIQSDPSNRGFVSFQNEWNDWGPADFFHYYSDPSYVAPATQRCRFPWDGACVYPNGDVSPCPDFPDYIVGNLYEASFPQIWAGKRFREFRTALAAAGRFPICSTCCQLYAR